MADLDEILARNEERLERLRRDPRVKALTRRRRRARKRARMARLGRMLAGGAAVAFAAFLFGLIVQPLGFAGTMLTLLAIALAVVLLAIFPRARSVDVPAAARTDLTALPGQVEHWLDSQRRLLPAPASRQIDAILLQLDVLGPQLAMVPPASKEAQDARLLLADHLPRLVETYKSVPQAYRGETQPANGQLIEGLGVVAGELDRLSRALAREQLTALEVEGRFLEQRYRGDTVGT